MSLLSRYVELYEWSRGTRYWRHTTAGRPVEYDGKLYAYVPGMKRGRIGQSMEHARSALEIEAPLTLDLLDQFRPFAPADFIRLIVRRIRINDGHVDQVWTGLLGDVAEMTHTAKLRCTTVMAAMSSNGLRRCWQATCPLSLYGQGLGECNVNPDAFREDVTLLLASGIEVQAAAFAAHEDGYYDGGVMRAEFDGGTAHHFVMKHVGETLTLLTPSRVPAGSLASVFPGCDQSLAVCAGRFNNELNYGGQHSMPKGKHPFDGNAVF